MAHKIPKLQYLNTSVTGTRTNGSPIITAIADTSDIEAGMVFTGTGIPTGAVVLSTTSSTVTLDKNATSTATASFNAYFEIVFAYPPIENKGEMYDAKERISVSLSGERQISVDYIEGLRDLKFSFLSEALKVLLETFFTIHAGLGNDFRYFDDQTTTTYIVYELSKLKWDPKKINSHGVSAYVWEVPLSFTRVV
jgi:hypothetical protein